MYVDTNTGKELSHENYLKHSGELDLKAICVFAATGFFLDEDTHYESVKALKPATEFERKSDGNIEVGKTYFDWHYSPRELTLKQATEEFTALFHRICGEQSKGTSIILPLSGGLDSRTLAAALKNHSDIQSYSYEYEGGEPETKFSEEIANAENFPFTGFKIEKGYLWNVIEELGRINLCCSEFTHPRQMAHINQTSKMGETFMLGHWGDVLFDGMGVTDKLGFEEQVNILYKKVLKKGGAELGKALWQQWSIAGNFDQYLKERISGLHQNIKIENANAKVRAFKSLYWAPRWTSSNLTIFNKFNQIALPYYHDEMCKFICTVPEHLLVDRQVQIEYLKKHAPELARIKRQGFGLDLYNFQDFHKWHKLPNRIGLKVSRILSGSTKIKRNYELQFIGTENESHLKKYIQHPSFTSWVDKTIVESIYEKFNINQVGYSHPLSVLLTLSVFHKLKTN